MSARDVGPFPQPARFVAEMYEDRRDRCGGPPLREVDDEPRCAGRGLGQLQLVGAPIGVDLGLGKVGSVEAVAEAQSPAVRRVRPGEPEVALRIRPHLVPAGAQDGDHRRGVSGNRALERRRERDDRARDRLSVDIDETAVNGERSRWGLFPIARGG